MADTKKQKAKRYTTPVGVAIYPKLNKPDEYQGKKQFKVTIRVFEDEAKDLRAAITEATDAIEVATRAELQDKVKSGKTGQDKAKAKKALEALEVKYPFAQAVDDDGDEVDQVDFKFSTHAEYKDQKTGEMVAKTLPIFDAQGKPMKKAVWGGSQIAVAFEMFPYYNPSANACGVSLRIAAVQVVELVTGSGGGNAESYGFEKREGYTEEKEEGASAEKVSEEQAEAGDENPDF